MTISRAGRGLLLLFVLSGCRGGDPGRDAPPDTTAALPAASADTRADSAAPLPTDRLPSPGSGPTTAAPAPQGVPTPSRETSRPAPAADSAARILTRAAERYGALRSLQADFTMRLENPLLRSTIASAGVLYQQRPDRLLLRFTDPDGDVIVSDGEYFWVYYPSVNAEQVMRSPAAQGERSGVDLQAQFLGNPVERFHYTLEGTERVGERSAWRMQLVPRERVGYRSLRVWLDQRDYLARRFEITEDNGSIRRFELRNVRVNPDLADALFRFQPPSGARVIAP